MDLFIVETGLEAIKNFRSEGIGPTDLRMHRDGRDHACHRLGDELLAGTHLPALQGQAAGKDSRLTGYDA